jgi:very-short-patch-repair endonuclease
VLSVLARRPNALGAADLREAFGEQGITLSELERAFLRLLASERLPLPVANKVAHSRYVDCRWPEHRLTVELDSYRYHRTRHAWEQDRRRERLARAAGDEFRRYTNNDVTQDQTLMLAELFELLP